MPTTEQLIGLLGLAHQEEQRFASELTLGQPELERTADDPAPRDTLAHVVFAKRRMLNALESARLGRTAVSTHTREQAIRYGAGRPSTWLEDEARRVATRLAAEVACLDERALTAAPEWIHEATLADEIVQQCVTHSLVYLLPMTPVEAAERSANVQARFVALLPTDIGIQQRSRGLYNLGCMNMATRRLEPAARALQRAITLRPELRDRACHDPDLADLHDTLQT